MEQMTNEMVEILNEGTLNTTESMELEPINNDNTELQSYDVENEDEKSGLGLLVGGLVAAGLMAGTVILLKSPKVRKIRRDLALKRALKMNELMELNIDEDEIIRVIDAKFGFDTVEEVVETEINNDEIVVED